MEHAIAPKAPIPFGPGDQAAELKEKVEEYADRYREKTAAALEKGADSVRDLGARGKRLGRRAGDRLDGASDYVRSHDLRETSRDLGTWTRRHPGALVTMAAVALGFFCGVVMVRR